MQLPLTGHSHQVEAAISEEISRFWRDYMGRNRDQREHDEDGVTNP
jgi:uncharacterized protein YbcI